MSKLAQPQCQATNPSNPLSSSIFSRKTGVFSTFLLLFAFATNAQTTLYVDAAKASNGVGTSWATAYKSLGDALAFAHANTTYLTQP
jgi:hypothetical protein